MPDDGTGCWLKAYRRLRHVVGLSEKSASRVAESSCIRSVFGVDSTEFNASDRCEIARPILGLNGEPPHLTTSSPYHYDSRVFRYCAMRVRHAACEPCRRAKLACDHSRPTCSRCRNRNQTDHCVYRDRPFRRKINNDRIRKQR